MRTAVKKDQLFSPIFISDKPYMIDAKMVMYMETRGSSAIMVARRKVGMLIIPADCSYLKVRIVCAITCMCGTKKLKVNALHKNNKPSNI